jgi:DMSO reductase family type II enzyme chaperone
MATAAASTEHPRTAEFNLYSVFASCLGHPSPERFSWLSGQECRRLLKVLTFQFLSKGAARRVRFFSDYSTYEAAYISLFEVGVPEPSVPLLESAYSRKIATQDVVLDCVNFYDVLGLRPSGSAFPPDHLVTQIEFLAAVRYLRENETLPENREPLRHLERDFIERHLLSWLPAACEKLEKNNPPLFPLLLRLLSAYLRKAFHPAL